MGRLSCKDGRITLVPIGNFQPWGISMKRLLSLFATGILLAGMVEALPQPASAQETNFNNRKRVTNFKSGRQAQPPARRTAREPIRFLGVFGGARRDEARPARGQPRLFFPGFGQPAGAPRGERLISPDSPVVEYVEKPKIYVYPDPRLVPLRGNVAGDAPIARVLAAGLARVDVERAHRKAILAFYKERDFAPVWTAGGDISTRAQDVMGLLAQARREGLRDAHYKVPVVWEALGDVEALRGDEMRLARLDVELTALALRYARHVSGGVVNPNRLSAYHDLKPPRVKLAAALKKLAEEPDAAAWLRSLAPRHPAYAAMRRELERLRGSAPRELLPAIPTGRLIRPGRRDARLPLIRRHLRKLGLLEERATDMVRAEPTAAREMADAAIIASAEAEDARADTAVALAVDERLYDETMVEAVRRFQRMAGLKPDGIIGRGTIGALNRRNSQDNTKARIDKLALNMERMRWMPRDWGREYVFVNQPAFTLHYVRDDEIVWKTRVIVGKPSNQTYFFSDMIRIVVFNPYWGVPQSIIRKEFIPKLMRDPYWLDREGYEVRDGKGRVISSASVNWAAYRNARVIPFGIRQRPGDDNALGRLKILFPNSHAIYLHDTPFKNLFRRDRRAFSHGCVRVQDPQKLAELVSGFDRYEIEQFIAAGKNKRVKLDHKTPVHLAYFTAWPGEDGKMRYHDDLYGRDRLLRTALNKHDAAYMRRAPSSREASAR